MKEIISFGRSNGLGRLRWLFGRGLHVRLGVTFMNMEYKYLVPEYARYVTVGM